MKMCVVRKVPYRLPNTKRLVWSLILAEQEGLTLLFVQKPDDNRSHELVIATENEKERFYEPVNVSTFPLENSDLGQIADKLNALGSEVAEDEFFKFLKNENFGL